MTREEFTAIIQDIEKNLEGDGYSIIVFAKDGEAFEGGWQPLISNPEVIVLSAGDMPPYYVPLSSIQAIQPSR